jgi:Kef-type K+ transport system membrane component KefB
MAYTDRTQAFPVLCRILTELKLLDTPVGLIVLAAGVGNDVVGESCQISTGGSVSPS